MHYVFVDCGTNYTLPHGHVNFTGRATTYNQSIPVLCELGYEIHGKDQITCLDDGQWSEGSECTIKGRILVIESIIYVGFPSKSVML